MIIISVSDLLMLDKFKKYKEVELVQLCMDEEVLEEAFEAGLEPSEGYYYEASTHRNWQNKIVTGYVLKGFYRKDREFRKSKFYTSEVASLMHRGDAAFQEELQKLQSRTPQYGENPLEIILSSYDDEVLLEGWKKQEEEILVLQKFLDTCRGAMFNEYGNPKRYDEWQSPSGK